MPRIIDRENTLARIGPPPDSCVPCAWRERGDALARSRHAVAFLTPYPVRWGHVIVVLRSHRESLEATPPEEWIDAAGLAHAAARAVERALEPARCFVASLGASDPSLPMSFPHLHLHVVPVYDPSDRPAEVFTWKHGVYEGEALEWSALRASLRRAWPRAPEARGARLVATSD